MITKNQILEKIAKEGLVEEMIELMNTNEMEINKQDLAQDIYVSLLTKDEEQIVSLYEKKELRWFIQRMLTNNVFSKTSPYHKTYRLFQEKTRPLKYKEGGDNGIGDEYDRD